MLAVNPVTPIDIGVLDLVNPEILPNDNVPQGLVAEPVVAIPTTLVVDNILHVNIPALLINLKFHQPCRCYLQRYYPH